MEHGVIFEKLTSGRISPRMISRLLAPVQAGDTLVALSLTRLARGGNMLCSVLRLLHDRGATVITLDDGRTYLPDESTSDFISQMEFFFDLATRIKAERGSEAQDKARAEGKIIGRPSGSLKDRKKLVLFGKEALIDSLRAEGRSIAFIASELGVSTGTVSNYLQKR